MSIDQIFVNNAIQITFIPFVVYNDVLVYETVFFLFKAKNTGLAALGRGFLTKKKGKTRVKYTSLYSINGITFSIDLNSTFILL